MLSTASIACGDSTDADGSGGKNATTGDEASTQSTTSGADCQPARGASEDCCLDLGVDACGAGLFCAAFDGRTVTTCYADRTRTDGEECNADSNCVSASCHPELRRCLAMPGFACEPALGCSDALDGNYACTTPELRCAKTDGMGGSPCDENDECATQVCTGGLCTGPTSTPCGELCLGCPNPLPDACVQCLEDETQVNPPSMCLTQAIYGPACQDSADCTGYVMCVREGGDIEMCQSTFPAGAVLLLDEIERACGGC